MTLGRRNFLLAAAILAGGCRAAGADEQTATDASVNALISAFQARRPSGPYALGLTQTSIGGVGVWTWRPAIAPAAPGTALSHPASYFERLKGRFGEAVALALVGAPGHASVHAAPIDGAFPVILFQPGASFGAYDYRLLLEDLASEGAIVLALNPLSSPRGSEARYAEAADEFRRLLDRLPDLAALGLFGDALLDRVILAGHSIGGAGAVLALDHPLAAAAINIDGDYAGAAARAAPNKPILYVSGQNPSEPASSEVRRARVWSEVRQSASDAVAVRLREMGHLDVTDGAVLATLADPIRVKAAGRNPPVTHAAVCATLRQWMRQKPSGDRWLPTVMETPATTAFA